MGTTSFGNQRIGWKYSTPLHADYLNTFLTGFNNPGLLSRPKFTLGRVTNVGCAVTINPFTMLIEPLDKVTSETSENGLPLIQSIVKVTTMASTQVNITPDSVALGFRYSFANGLVQQSSWYGEFVVIGKNEASTFDGIIIATVQSFLEPGKEDRTENYKYSVTTSGAEISDALLRDEGWNPECWLSLISPRRRTNGKYNQLEVRFHNELFGDENSSPLVPGSVDHKGYNSGFVSGINGLVKLTSQRYTMNTNVDETLNPDGIRGIMPYNYNPFSLHTSGLMICHGSDTSPTESSPITNLSILYSFTSETASDRSLSGIYRLSDPSLLSANSAPLIGPPP